MEGKRRLLTNLMALGLGTACSKLAVFLLMPLYTAALTPADFGAVDILINTAVLLIPLCSLYAPESVFRFAAGGEEEAQVLSVGGWLLRRGSLALLLILPIMALVAPLRAFLWHLILYVVAAILHSYYSHILRARGQYGFFAVQQIFCTLATVLLAYLLLTVLELGAAGYLAAVYLADAVTAAILHGYLRPKAQKERDGRLQGAMLRYGLPLIPTATLWWVISALDRYVLLWQHGRGAVGLYAAACKLPAFITLASGIFLEVWHFVALRTDEKERRSVFDRVYALFLPALVLLALMLILGGRFLLRALVAADFEKAAIYLPFITVAMLFSALSSFLGSIYTVRLRTGATLATAALGAAVHTVACFLLIPRLGAWGAIVATAASYLAVFARRAVDCHRFMPFSLRLSQLALSLGGLILTAACMAFGRIGWAFVSAPAALAPFWRELLTAFCFVYENIKTFCRISTKKGKHP